MQTPTFNTVLLWNNNYGGQVNDAALGDFIARAHPDMISFDTYPYAPGVAAGRRQPDQLVRRLAPLSPARDGHGHAAGGLPPDLFLSDRRTPNARRLAVRARSLQTFAALAFNAKSLQDFTYNFSQTLFDSTQGGDNQITPLGTAAQAMNAEAKRLGPALVRLRPIVDPTHLAQWDKQQSC